MNPLLTEFQQNCDKVINLLQDDLNTVKTGRAKPSLVEHIKVNVYGGTWMEVRELASITAPDPQTLEITLWDKSITKDFVRGLSESEARVNPVVQGDKIRIIIPPLTEETRRDLVKLVHQKIESHKTMVRQERNETKKSIEETKNTSGVSEDDVKRDLEIMQEITDKTIEKVDEIGKQKEAEIMTV
jgi:ribosome recycling factor